MPVEDDFLHAIVRPIYNFLKQQVLLRKDDPISERVMYDDVNEAFWSRSLVLQLMPQVTHCSPALPPPSPPPLTIPPPADVR